MKTMTKFVENPRDSFLFLDLKRIADEKKI